MLSIYFLLSSQHVLLHSWNSWDGSDQVACAVSESALYETYYTVCSDHLSSVLRDRLTDGQTEAKRGRHTDFKLAESEVQVKPTC